ncbi:MAG: DivIVA domain-containing protein [Firmicutes bacterium]|jgi:cell division initiation protein|nr:DivIVA domain-containing protein [Bacillota bacterium]
MLTPLEVHGKEFSVRFRGYDSREVEEFLDQVAESYEQLWRENSEFRDRIQELTGKQDEYSDIGETLKQTLVMAQKAADDARRNAEEKARLIVETAEREAAAVHDRMQEKVRAAEKRVEELAAQEATFKARMRALLESYMELLKNVDRDLGIGQAAAARD